MAISEVLKFKGSKWLRQRVVLSVLSGIPIRIEAIRAMEENPGLSESEVDLLKLLEKITNGSRTEINETGTVLKYYPGFIVGGSGIEHQCSTERAVGYYLEALIFIAPFAKRPLQITLFGVTNAELDLSPDLFRVVTLPLLKNFGISEGLELQIKKRGAPPLGGGELIFKCPIVNNLNPVKLLESGMIKRIRGIAYTTKMSPVFANRSVSSARALLNNFIPDVWIYTDHYKGPSAGLSPGFGLSLVAEATNGLLLSAERVADKSTTPEELGQVVSKLLCDEIAQAGCVDSLHQNMMLLFMTLCPEDVSQIRTGKLVPSSIAMLRNLKKFFGVVFRVDPDASNNSLVLSCRGIGFQNMSRKAK